MNLNESLAGGPAPAINDETIGVILETEDEHLPNMEYLERLRNGELDLTARMDVLNWITEVHTFFNFSPDCAYLAINYMDRFLSVHDLPEIAWAMQLLALACVSIAAKMEETEVPLSTDLQVGNCGYVFEGKIIQRMELLVLSTLKWRMLAVTPFRLLRCFLKKVMVDYEDDDENRKGLIHLILNMITGGIQLSEFKPSEIAAAMAMSIAWKTKSVPIEQSISLFNHNFRKEKVLKCFDLVNGSSSSSSSSYDSPLLPSLPQSPKDVLDASEFLNYNSNSKAKPIGSFDEDNFQISPCKKRRKLNGAMDGEI